MPGNYAGKCSDPEWDFSGRKLGAKSAHGMEITFGVMVWRSRSLEIDSIIPLENSSYLGCDIAVDLPFRVMMTVVH